MSADASHLPLHRPAVLTPAAFQLKGGQGSLTTQGIRHTLARGPIHDLPQRTEAFFRTHDTGPALLTGVLPFDRDQPDFLTQPVSAQRHPAMPDGDRAGMPWTNDLPVAAASKWRVASRPDRQTYAHSVAEALRLIQQAGGDDQRKIVLARSLLVSAGERLDPMRLWRRLSQDRSITAFIAPLPNLPTGEPATLIGATPELLLKKTGTLVASHPLAGSLPRNASTNEDQRAARQLLRSEKDLREHRHVVAAILDTLAPHCSQLHAPQAPSLRPTATMWHLGTPIEGTLRSADITCAELLRDLHPTPAVCGTPRDWARQMIQRLEDIDRGFFAGAVGWTDARGDGTWHVSIRCAELQGTQARLFAGAGIVAGSDPEAEAAETAAKFQAMLQALRLERIVTGDF